MLCLCSGCAAEHPAVPRDESVLADSIVALLGRIDTEDMKRSFEPLSELSFTRYERTEQFDAAGNRLAFEERQVARDGRALRVMDRDSSGAFDFGYVRPFASKAGERAPPSNLPAYVVPDDPAYASPRNMEAYAYEPVADTTLHGREVRIVRIRARPGVGDGQPIRRAHLYLDAETDRLVGIYMERVDAALWFREESLLFLSIDQLDSGEWVPRQTRFETFIKLPFRPAQRFRTVTSYYAVGGRA